MTLEQWAKEEKEHIERFLAWWKEHDGEEGFPNELPPGEWDEQFRSWTY